MKSAVFAPIVSIFVLFLCLGLNSTVQSETIKKSLGKSEQVPIVIKSDTLEVDNEKNVITFAGKVNAKRDDFAIDCHKMVVYYKKLPGKANQPDQEKTSIDRIVATGQVKISRTEGGIATAGMAIYFEDEDKLILTEDPVIKQGNDFVEGDKVTVYLKENRSVIDSSKGNRVKATIFPNRSER